MGSLRFGVLLIQGQLGTGSPWLGVPLGWGLLGVGSLWDEVPLAWSPLSFQFRDSLAWGLPCDGPVPLVWDPFASKSPWFGVQAAPCTAGLIQPSGPHATTVPMASAQP